MATSLGGTAKKIKQSLTHREYVRLKALGILGLVSSNISPLELENRYTFVNDIGAVKTERLNEYNTWYSGDSDKLKNYFTRANAIDYNTDPLYNENRKSYFWAVSSTERDIKRTHSGAPRNIVDTLVNIMSNPTISHTDENVNKNITKILKANKFNRLLSQQSRPLTLVEGWGAWKINWDKSLSEYPIILYYRANNVDFIYSSNQLVAIIYRDYFEDENKKKYILYETRRIGMYNPNPNDSDSKPVPSLFIEKDLYQFTNSEIMVPCSLTSLPQLKDVQAQMVIPGFRHFLGYPNVFYNDSSEEFPGRSIFTGKCDLFDDLDQCLSQSANAVRRSTIHEYFNTLYLETDEEGLPMMPNAFDRKYIQFKGSMGSDGTAAGTQPVQVVQPAINFEQYSAEEKNILLQIINGIMSPATIGIDIAKKDNASDTREKEKLTIFTRNGLLDEERDILEHLISDVLCAYELMNNGVITCRDYEISIQYGEFANSSLESKLETILTGWQGGILSDESAIDLLWGNSLSADKKNKELDFLKEQRESQQQAQQPFGQNPEDQGMFGQLGAENAYNDSREKAAIDDLKEDMNIPELGTFDSYDYLDNRKKRLKDSGN